jgi:hypothetical protein
LPVALLEESVALPPAQNVVASPVATTGVDGPALTLTAIVRAVLVAQLFVAVTLSVPDVALAPNDTLALLPLGVIVAPMPL